MAVSNVDYLERFLSDVDRVIAGTPGAISDDRWLVTNYDPSRFDRIVPYLKFHDPRVRAEVVTLMGNVRERGVRDMIVKMKDHEGDKVAMACLGYLSVMREDDESIPGLLDIMDHTRGMEFTKAARRLAGIARTSDLQHVRRIYGQVDGRNREDARVVMEGIIARDPSLEATRDLILSVPVYPDETDFERFLDVSIEYLDVRYRKNILPRTDIKSTTYNNVVQAIKRMRVRMYNEADNLQYYGPDKDDRFHELSTLMRWASNDLSGKKVIETEAKGPSRTCPRCGGMLSCFKGMWSCPDCGGDA